MKKTLVVVMALLLVLSLTVSAFAYESVAVKFEEAGGKTASGETEPIFQMKGYSEFTEFTESTAVAVTFTSEGLPHLNLRSKTSPFSDSDNIWMFIAPSKVEENVAYFTFEDAKKLYLDGTCQNSGKKAADLQPDFNQFLKDACDWIGIYTYDNTVTVTKVEIVRMDTVATKLDPEPNNMNEEPEDVSNEHKSEVSESIEPASKETKSPETGVVAVVSPVVLALIASVMLKKKQS